MFLIDLLQGSGQICGMMSITMTMVIIGMMIKIKFLSSTIVSGSKGSKNLNKRTALTHCLASIKIMGLVLVRRQKKEGQNNCRHKQGFFCIL